MLFKEKTEDSVFLSSKMINKHQRMCRSTRDHQSRDIWFGILLIATLDLHKIMNNGIVTLAVALMTSHASLALTAYKTYEKVSEKSLSQQPEMTLSALSQIDCAINCRKYPHCTAFAYDDHSSLCLLFSSMPATVAGANHTSSSGLSVYTDTSSHCLDTALNVSHGLVSVQRSLWSVEGNITCDNDYLLLPNVTSAVTCLADGSWSTINAECVKRVWRYPETKMILGHVTFPIPGSVIKGWSLCVEGVPTTNTETIVEIFQGSSSNRPVHTSWRFPNCLALNDMISGSWGAEVDVWTPPFPLVVGKPFFYRLTMNTSTSVDVSMDNVFFKRFNLRFPPSSFTLVNIYGDVNVTKVETWCTG